MLKKLIKSITKINLLDKYMKSIFILITGYFFILLFKDIFFVVPLEPELNGVELYKYFLKTFLSFDMFTDRYGYGFHIIHSIVLFPFLIFQYFLGNINFNGIGFSIIKSDIFINQILFYSGRFISLLGLIITFFYSYKTTYFFTKNKLLSYLPIFLLLSSSEILLNSTRLGVDSLLVGFLIGAFFYAIIFLDDYKMKNLCLFIFFSIFAFIIKYQALMFIFWLYIIILFYLIYEKKYNYIYKGMSFFLLVFVILNHNYGQLFNAMSQSFDLNSKYMSLTQEELINLTYGFKDWVLLIINGVVNEFNVLIFIIIYGIFNFFFLINGLKTKYIIVILLPIIMNYYLFTYVNILNGRHFLLLLIVLSIISTIGFGLLLSVTDKYNKTKIILTIIMLMVVLNYSYKAFNLYIYNNYYSNINKNEKKNNLQSILLQGKPMFFSSCHRVIPYGVNYLLDSNNYCYSGNNISEKRNYLGEDKEIIRYDFKTFYNILKKEKIIFLFESDYLKFVNIKNDFTIIYSDYYDKRQFFILKNNEKAI